MDFNGMLQFSAALFAMSLIAPPKRIANERFFVASHLSYWNQAATFFASIPDDLPQVPILW